MPFGPLYGRILTDLALRRLGSFCRAARRTASISDAASRGLSATIGLSSGIKLRARSCALFRWRGGLGGGLFRCSLLGRGIDFLPGRRFAPFVRAECDLALFARKLARRRAEPRLGPVNVEPRGGGVVSDGFSDIVVGHGVEAG